MTLSRPCAVGLAVFAVLWVAALALLAIGTFGLFGQPRDPLSAVFLVPLGLPWNLLPLGSGGGGAALAILAPGLNLGLLWLVCRRLGRGR